MFEQGRTRCSRFANQPKETFPSIQIKAAKQTLDELEITYR